MSEAQARDQKPTFNPLFEILVERPTTVAVAPAAMPFNPLFEIRRETGSPTYLSRNPLRISKRGLKAGVYVGQVGMAGVYMNLKKRIERVPL